MSYRHDSANKPLLALARFRWSQIGTRLSSVGPSHPAGPIWPLRTSYLLGFYFRLYFHETMCQNSMLVEEDHVQYWVWASYIE